MIYHPTILGKVKALLVIILTLPLFVIIGIGYAIKEFGLALHYQFTDWLEFLDETYPRVPKKKETK